MIADFWSPAFPGADRGNLLQYPPRAIDDRVIDELAVELDRGDSFRLCLRESRDGALGEGDFILARREDAVDHTDLVRVDAHLALEAVGQCRSRRGFEALRVLQIDPYRIERRLDSGGARGGDDRGAGMG